MNTSLWFKLTYRPKLSPITPLYCAYTDNDTDTNASTVMDFLTPYSQAVHVFTELTKMTQYYLGQINIARSKYALDDPRFADFVNALDRINQVAEQSPGFIWRLKDETDHAMDLSWFSDPMIIVNASIWTDLKPLQDFVYRSVHIDYLTRRAEWFDELDMPSQVLWWQEQGKVPSLEDLKKRHDSLCLHGPNSLAFTPRSLHKKPEE